MPISVGYDQSENVIYTKAEGVIQLDDIISYFKSLAALKPKEGYRVLADYSDVSLKLSSEDIHKMAQQRMKVIPSKEKINIAVFCKNDLVFGLGRMYEALLRPDTYNVMVFRSHKEAMEWLGV